jgi:glycosyltransferase involved in cell wall biosynthesis
MMPLASPERSVALVHWTFSPTVGGVESHLAALARGLAHAGWRVTVFTGEPSPVSIPGAEIVSSALLALDHACSAEPRSHAHELEAFLVEAFAARNIAVAHGHNLHHFSPVPGRVLTSLKRTLAVAIHHTFHEAAPVALTEQAIYAEWDGLYAVSRYIAGECRRLIGISPRVWRLGVDTALFRPRASGSASAGVILHPARLLRWKGADVAVRALASLRAMGLDARLVLTDSERIADRTSDVDDYRAEVIAEVKRNRLVDHVDLVSAAYSSMPELYARAGVVVYPTTAAEPLGLGPLEAMSCGRPVVASACGGIRETVVHGATGYLVPPGDADALARHTAPLLVDSTVAESVGARGRQLVLAQFDLRRYISELISLYEVSRLSDLRRNRRNLPRTFKHASQRGNPRRSVAVLQTRNALDIGYRQDGLGRSGHAPSNRLRRQR